MYYPKLAFPNRSGRPFFYTNFVATVDGKVAVKREGYFPIGSKLDYRVLLELRANADCLIHGGNLGRKFGEITLKSLNNSEFKTLRKKLGKTSKLPYYVVTKNPESLRLHLKGGNVNFYKKDPNGLAKHLKRKGYKNALVEGGPTLLASFLKANLIDEIFLTIAPKIFGSDPNTTLTLVEGYLFPKNAIKNLSLLSVKKARNELFLRYKVAG